MCLNPVLKLSFSLLEKSTIWSFELLKRNSVISLCCYTLDLIEGLQRKNVDPTLHWNKICDFCYPLQKVQQKEGFFTMLSCTTRRAMGQCAKISLNTGRSWIIWTLLIYILGQLSEVHNVLTQNIFLSFFFLWYSNSGSLPLICYFKHIFWRPLWLVCWN